MPTPFRLLAWSVAVVTWLGSVGAGRAERVPPSVLPGLAGDSVRVAVDVEQFPWRGVVRVQTEVGVRCTGALIGLRAVLTAAHCLLGRGTGRLVRPGSVHVLTGYARGSYDAHARATAVETGPGFAPGPDGQPSPAAPPDADWAVLLIDVPLGTPDRVLPLAAALPAPGSPVALGGFEQDRAQVLLADLACRVAGVVRISGATMLRHSCAGTRGASGAPLLARDGDRWVVAGVASVAFLGAAGGEAVPATAVAAGSATLRRGGP